MSGVHPDDQPEVTPNLADIADRAVVMGECWICAGVIACQNPELCGYTNNQEGVMK